MFDFIIYRQEPGEDEREISLEFDAGWTNAGYGITEAWGIVSRHDDWQVEILDVRGLPPGVELTAEEEAAMEDKARKSWRNDT